MLCKEMETGANMQCTLDTGEILSENASLVEIEEEVASMQASSSKTKVPRKVILGYISPIRYEVHNNKLTRNPEGARVLAPLD